MIWIFSFAWLFAPANNVTPTSLLELGESDRDRMLSVILVAAHLIGEVLFAALLGLWIEQVLLADHIKEVKHSPEYAFGLRKVAESIADLFTIGLRSGQKRDFLLQRGAARRAYVMRILSLYDFHRKSIALSTLTARTKYLENALHRISANEREITR